MLDLNEFIKSSVVNRDKSLFAGDIEKNSEELKEKIEGKSVLVIGGAGSIGSAFIKEILNFRPSGLYVVDTNENGLTELTRDLRSLGGYIPGEYLTYPMDYSSAVFERFFRHKKGFDIVANFSAHKHVRSEKDIFSIEAMLTNNLLNAEKLLILLEEFPPEAFFSVSTDKAANPVNIMGASKRILEDLIFQYSEAFNVNTARFANVAFSNGSLPDGFLKRLEKKQPLCAPSDVKRYFVSPGESGEICLLACMLGKNREIFFPKLKEEQMLGFDTIAERLLAARGYEMIKCGSEEEARERANELFEGSRRYPVFFSGSDTSGEKAYEEFYTEEEKADLTRFLSLGVIEDKPVPDRIRLMVMFNRLKELFLRDDVKKEDIVRALEEYLPEFKHIETGASLDSKM